MSPRRLSLLLCLLLAALVPARAEEPPADQQKLVGHWRYVDETHEQTADYDFRPDGTYTSELRKNGEIVRKFEGLWKIQDGMIVYTYSSDSLQQVRPGAVERDRLLRIDESSYTIEAGDRAQRTYWRVKETSDKK